MNHYRAYQPSFSSVTRLTSRTRSTATPAFALPAKRRNHKEIIVAAIVVVLALLLSAIYLMNLSDLSTSSYEILSMETERSSLIDKNEKIKVEIFTSSSLKSISESELVLGLAQVDDQELVSRTTRVALR